MLFYCLLGFMVSLKSFKSLFLCNASFFSGCFQDNFLFLWFLAVCLWYIWAWISLSFFCFRLTELTGFISLSFVKLGALSVIFSVIFFFKEFSSTIQLFYSCWSPFNVYWDAYDSMTGFWDSIHFLLIVFLYFLDWKLSSVLSSNSLVISYDI